MQGRPAARPLATHQAFDGLLALQTGASYAVDSPSLAMALMAGPSTDGAWCAVVGSSEFGLEAAAAAGVELSRTILVPDPGDQWINVTAALIDVLTVLVVKPPSAVAPGAAAKLSARLRQRGAMLIAWGEWPRCDARLSLSESSWSGMGRGYGHLVARQVTVSVARGGAPATRRRLWMPDDERQIRIVETPLTSISKVS